MTGLVSVFQCMSRGQENYLDFFKSNKPGNPRQVCPELEYVIAVLLKVGGGGS